MSRVDRETAVLAKNTGLPSSYGKSYLALLQIEPGFAHALWEVTPEDSRRAVNQLCVENSTAVWILRFYQTECRDCENAATFDLEIEFAPRNWYVRFGPNRRVCFAEIGIRAPSGLFVPVCNSNVIDSAEAEHGRYDQPKWLRVTEGNVAPAPPGFETADSGSTATRSPQPEAVSMSSEKLKTEIHNPQCMSSFGWGTAPPAPEKA